MSENNTSNFPNVSKDLSTYEQIRELYLQSGLSQAELAEVTGINKGTLEFWLSNYRKTPVYAVEYIRHKLELHFKRNVNNGDVIRDMSNQEINDFLLSIRNDAEKANWNINDMKPEYTDFEKYMYDIQLIKPYNQTPTKKQTDDEYNGMTDREKIRKIYEKSGLSYSQLSNLTGISRTTLSNWLSRSNTTTDKVSPHASFMADYIQYKVDDYLKENKCNGDVIREMSNEKLAEFLSDLRNSFLEAKGNPDELPNKYRKIELFADETHLVRPRFITDNSQLSKRR